MSVVIPLFPLGVVLFPHMPLPLHIFEERYRVMMQDCQKDGTGFGIVALRDGVEVTRAPTPHRVGTLAQLRRVEPLDNGRYNVLVVGASRYRIESITTGRPYLVAAVDYLEDSSGDAGVAASLARRVAAAFRRYATTLRELADEKPAQLDLPDDPELLSYLVSATLQIELRHKQHLLEMDSAEDRLRLALQLLRREAVLLEHKLAKRDMPFATVSPN